MATQPRYRSTESIGFRDDGKGNLERLYSYREKPVESGGSSVLRSSAEPYEGAGRGFVNPPEVNTRRQYEREKEAGDPNALKLSFEEWKKL